MDPQQPVFSLMKRFCPCLSLLPLPSQDWSKSDERLLQAVEQNEPDKVSALIVKKGLCPTKLDAEGKSAFHLSVSRGRLDCLEVIISHGADISVTDGAGLNALHLAAKNGQPECLKRLLQERLAVDCTDSIGRTALHHAAISGCLSCTEILWDFKANLDVQDSEGATPLTLAAQTSRVELCVFLLSRGANANIQDNQGRSSLMLACESNSVETVQALLRGGANTQLVDSLGHKAVDYSTTTGNQRIIRMLQDGLPPASEGTGKESPQIPSGASSVQGGTSPRKRKAPPPPHSPLQIQGLPPSPQPQNSALPAPSPEPQKSQPPSPLPSETQQSAQAEDEEVFEEIRRLRLERGRLLQKIKALEQQQQSALSALEELSQLKQRLEEAEAERDKLLEELKGGHGIGASDSEDMDEMLEFPEKLLSKRSRASSAQDEATFQTDTDSANPSPAPADQRRVAELCKQIEELTSQNSELVLKVQMLEMFEKDDTDMQATSLDSVPMAQYETLRKEFETLQERLSQAQASEEASSVTEEQGDKKSEEVADADSTEALKEKLRGLEEELASSQSELEELKEQMRLGVLSVECAEGDIAAAVAGAAEEGPSQEAQQLRARVTELEEELAKKQGEAEGQSSQDSDTIKQLTEKVKELQAALAQNDSVRDDKEKEDKEGETETVKSLRDRVAELEIALAESRTSGKDGGAAGDGEQVRRLQERLGELEGELRKCVPRSELEEVQVTLGLQCEQLARERADVARRLNDALLELERLRPPPCGDDDEEEEEHSESSEPSVMLDSSRRTLAAVREELEVARQEAAQALDCLCAEREGRAQDALQLKDAVPLSKHKEALSAVSEQLAQTLQELQEEKTLRAQVEEQACHTRGQTAGHAGQPIPKEEHEKVKAELQHALQASESSAAAAQDALTEKEMELRELKSQKAAEQGPSSKEDHEGLRLSLQAEINAITALQTISLGKHEKTCTEVFQVQREALFNKSERQVAESQLATVQQQLYDLQSQSSHIQELHKDIQESQGLVKRKRTITELSKEVFRLKRGLGALSPPLGITSSSSSSSTQHGNPGQQMALQNRISILTQQLQDWERKHRQVVAVYRSHLLAAVQGHMDEEVQALLLQILRMTQQGH
ncbi:LOW QUALITY PROTEIN: ankyrin repeat domain-containing protein 24 [Melanotaenia boesemani]|uniref:LOW QUALITY PROTEIN: ankyrin repeat domain-containing protein 24 n=1 Tax=Melanotaenia boesemani TaxID=1250792 RepID=UPI001C047B0F|nr:LOW QUALITY PROTEIN: ankyrin repeat domain-containing protein 24 [Melanotaenia boesemani]